MFRSTYIFLSGNPYALPAIHIQNESEITFDSMILYQIRIECVLRKYIHLNWILGTDVLYIEHGIKNIPNQPKNLWPNLVASKIESNSICMANFEGFG